MFGGGHKHSFDCYSNTYYVVVEDAMAINEEIRRQVKMASWYTVRYHIYFFPVYFDVHGCQMNTNDTEIAWSILQNKGFIRTHDVNDVSMHKLIRKNVADSPSALHCVLLFLSFRLIKENI